MKFFLSPFSIALVSGTAAFIAVCWLAVGGQLKQMGTLQAEVDSRTVSRAKISSGGDQQRQVEAWQAVGTQAQALLPEQDEQYDLSVQIEAAAKQVGVSLGSLAFTSDQAVGTPTSAAAESASASDQKSGVKQLSLSLTASGSYDQLRNFVQRITSLSRLISVDQLTMTQQKEGMSLQLTAFAYYLP